MVIATERNNGSYNQNYHGNYMKVYTVKEIFLAFEVIITTA